VEVGVRRGRESLQLAGVAAAVVLAVVANVLGARHFARWDWTAENRWSLSPATTETLRTLERRVDVWVIAGASEPLAQALQQLLVAYQAGSSRIEVHWIDPDRDTVQLVDLQQRFGLQAGRSEDGRVATDAIVLVASGDRHWFLTPQDLFEQADDVHVRPREERALTQAIRSVLGGEKARLCFTVGHGELSIDAERDEREGLGAVRDLLEKDNYELASVDLGTPAASDVRPLAGCTVAVVAGPQAPFAPVEAARLRTWLMEGGSLLAVVGPLDAATPTGLTPAGLDDVLASFGIGLDDVVVHDVDDDVAVADTHGEGFFVEARPHPVTRTLVVGGSDPHPPRVATFYARSLHHVSPPGAPAAADLLVTTAGAFAKASISGASAWKDVPPREPDDAQGPFVIAMASERARIGPSAPHGPRAVVLGSRFALAEENWRQPRTLHGTAFLVDSALSWLSARPEVVDVPDKPEVDAGMRVGEQGRTEVKRYVLVFMPLAALLLGLAVWAWRRSSENKPYERESKEPSG
jgi:hypothetical protein